MPEIKFSPRRKPGPVAGPEKARLHVRIRPENLEKLVSLQLPYEHLGEALDRLISEMTLIYAPVPEKIEKLLKEAKP